MNKLIFSGLLISVALAGFVLVKPAMANEGIVLLRGAGTAGSCFMASVFIDGTYRVLGTCRDLKVALSPEQNHYVVWANDEKLKTKRLGEIVNGKLSTSTSDKFTDLFITAENDGYLNKPSDNILLSGPVQQINFESGAISGNPSVTANPTPTPKKTITTAPTLAKGATPTIADTNTDTPSNGIGGALSTVLKIALFGFGALLLIVGVFSFISRKRAL